MAFRSQLCQVSFHLKDMGIRTLPVDGKEASILWKEHRNARFTDRQIHRWFDPNPPGGRDVVRVTGVAAITGPMSNRLATRDFDTLESARRWMDGHPAIARRCPIVRTRRGYQIHFRLRRGIRGFHTRFVDGEMIADGKHYVLMPPSRHPSGWHYQYRNGEPHTIADFPELDPFAVGLCDAVRLDSGSTRPEEEDKGRKAEAAAFNTAELSQDFNLDLNDLNCSGNDVFSILAATVPRQMGERNAKLWYLARLVKSLPEFEDASADDAKDVFDAWMESARPFVRNKDERFNWDVFCRCWENAKVLIRPRLKVDVAEICGRYRNLQYHRVIEHAAGLYSRHGDFHLTVREIETNLGIHRNTAWTIMSKLVTDDVLEIVKRHKWVGQGTKGTYYRFAIPHTR